ncbi:MAG: hypothetical protein ACTSUB_07880, partial [Candidatus Thorarchaeota archaeon]
TIAEYETFLEEQILETVGMNKLERYYDDTVASMKKDFEESVFFVELNNKMHSYNDRYIFDKGYSLLSTDDSTNNSIEILTKPFTSMISKCYRKDILQNTRWNEAKFGFESEYYWINPLSCFEHINID